jgi:cell division protein FtsQ
VPTVRAARQGANKAFAALDRALGRVLRPLADLLPRRLRRAAERIEKRRSPIGQVAAGGFLLTAATYGLIVSGQLGRVADGMLVAAGFGIENVRITGGIETPELAILEKLEIGGASLLGFDADAARDRIAELPWIEGATIRKFYPDTLRVEVVERRPLALWQSDGEVVLVDATGHRIVPLEDARFVSLPFLVGDGANVRAADFLTALRSEPLVASRMRAAVLVADRRWDLHLENGVTVKLPERRPAQALSQLVRLDERHALLSRDVTVIDMRLTDRLTVRLPEGRTLEEVIEGPSGDPIADAAPMAKAAL